MGPLENEGQGMMDENTVDQSTDQEISLDSVDDVDAHGIKEIVAGVATVAAIGGGVAAVVASTGGSAESLASPVSAVHVVHAADSATTATPQAAAAGVTSTLADAPANIVEHTLAATSTTPVGGVVDGATQSALNLTAKVAGADVKLDVAGVSVDLNTNATSAASHTVHSVDTTVNKDVTTLGHDVSGTTVAAENSVHKTVEGVNTAVSDSVSLHMQSTTIHLESVTKTVHDEYTAVVKVSGALGHELAPGGTVTITNGQGQTVGSVNMASGEATLNFSGAAGSTFNLHYGGDSAHAPATLEWVAPAL